MPGFMLGLSVLSLFDCSALFSPVERAQVSSHFSHWECTYAVVCGVAGLGVQSLWLICLTSIILLLHINNLSFRLDFAFIPCNKSSWSFKCDSSYMQILVKTWRGKAAVPQLVEDGHGSESVLFGLCPSLHHCLFLLYSYSTLYQTFFWHFLSLVIKTMRFNTGFMRWVGNITASVPNYSDCLQNSQTCQWLDALAGAYCCDISRCVLKRFISLL